MMAFWWESPKSQYSTSDNDYFTLTNTNGYNWSITLKKPYEYAYTTWADNSNNFVFNDYVQKSLVML